MKRDIIARRDMTSYVKISNYMNFSTKYIDQENLLQTL